MYKYLYYYDKIRRLATLLSSIRESGVGTPSLGTAVIEEVCRTMAIDIRYYRTIYFTGEQKKRSLNLPLG